MMQTINTFLPSITLAALLLALWMLSTSQQQTQAFVTNVTAQQQHLINITSEQERVSRILQGDIVNLESEQTALGVRLVRLESAICSLLPTQRTVQCP